MQTFAYLRPSDAAAAITGHQGDHSACFIAGGTDVLGLLKDGVIAPDVLVDLNDLPLQGIEAGTLGVVIGALARLADVAVHPDIRRGFPVLSQAIMAAASPQLRNMATLGGNLLQRTRCGYFRDPVMPCNKRETGSGCSAISGASRSHAVFGTSLDCVAVHPSDPAVALLALDAVIRTDGPHGPRGIPIVDLHQLPGQTPGRETVLEPGEIIVAIEVPATPLARRSCYVKVADRASFDFALVAAAVAMDLRDGIVRTVRVALGGVAPIPWRAVPVEDALSGQPLNRATIEAAAHAMTIHAQPLRDNAFKVNLLPHVIRRALMTVEGL
ncbi:MAG: FAD binding domain-containing protein [Euzebya sp.]